NVAGRDADALLLEIRRPVHRTAATLLHFHPHEVAVDFLRIDQTRIDAMEALRQALGVGVILAQPLHHRFERNDAGGRDGPRLAHVATYHAAVSSRTLDERLASAENRADGSGQAFRNAKADGL